MKRHKSLAAFPILGILLYVILFFLAKIKYAGGLEQYIMGQHLLCDLMERKSESGAVNDARYYAIIGHIFLFIGMSIFFYILPQSFKKLKKKPPIFQITGTVSMFLFLFLATDYHDLFVLIAGSIAVFTGFLLIYAYRKEALSLNSVLGIIACLLYTSPSPRDGLLSRMPSSA